MRAESQKVLEFGCFSFRGLTQYLMVFQHCFIIQYQSSLKIEQVCPPYNKQVYFWRSSKEMRFEVGLKRDKLKSIQNIIIMTIALMKAKQTKYSVYFIFVAAQNQIRILVQSQVVPIVIVLTSEIFTKIVSVSKNEATNSSIGFELKNGLSFLENFLSSIREDSGNLGLVSEQEKTLVLKLTKDKDFRSLEVKLKDKMKREEIQKPTKNENQLFTYEWIDGVTRSQAFFEINPAGIIQILKVVSKIKNHYIIQVLEQKKLSLIIDIDQAKLNLKLKQLISPLEVSTKFSKIEGPTHGKCEYEIKIDDAEMLMLAMKNQCLFVLDQEKMLSLSYNGPFYNCQICLKGLINLVMSESMEDEDRNMLKRQMVLQ